MALSLFDIFKIGLGPSSSHTTGPMTAARMFVDELAAAGAFDRTASVQVELYGSLALTGRGHHTDKAILLGLQGKRPEAIDPDEATALAAAVVSAKNLPLGGTRKIPFDPDANLTFNVRNRLPFHSNGMRLIARDQSGNSLHEAIYYSVGGGFVVEGRQASGADAVAAGIGSDAVVPYEFRTARELLEICRREGLRIADVVRANEAALGGADGLDGRIDAIWAAMEASIARGCRQEGVLPGMLKTPRRAAGLFQRLSERRTQGADDGLAALDWVNLWAIAVNEENAAGGRVVTAPTNGASGLLPAVLMHYRQMTPDADDAGVRTFLLTATAIGSLYKYNASFSGAEVGCQGEVGVACSMAAGGLAAALGGSNEQVENAAEIGMEHNLGLTCDPVGGLVQIPCIERNAMGAVKAIDAARLALLGDGSHRVSLDNVIKTMWETGRDMRSKYKETSLGGLAANIVEC